MTNAYARRQLREQHARLEAPMLERKTCTVCGRSRPWTEFPRWSKVCRDCPQPGTAGFDPSRLTSDPDAVTIARAKQLRIGGASFEEIGTELSLTPAGVRKAMKRA